MMSERHGYAHAVRLVAGEWTRLSGVLCAMSESDPGLADAMMAVNMARRVLVVLERDPLHQEAGASVRNAVAWTERRLADLEVTARRLRLATAEAASLLHKTRWP